MVEVKEFAAPQINKKEIHRYAGERVPSAELSQIIDECLPEILDKLTYKVSFCKTSVRINKNEVDLGFLRVESSALAKNLSGCDAAIIFAATVGLAPDRLVARNLVSSPTRALVFDAIGAERIESLSDAFCEDLRAKIGNEKKLRPRFSAGYGDLDIEVQRDIFRLLDCPKNIGLTLTESLLMTPSKSVTAIIGIF